jgi:hypothetical protein
MCKAKYVNVINLLSIVIASTGVQISSPPINWLFFFPKIVVYAICLN